MKRIISAIICFCFIITVSGCKNSTDITPVCSNLSFKAEISFGGQSFEYQAVMTPASNKDIELQLTDTTSDIQYIFKNNNITEKLYNLEYSSAVSSLPSGSVIDLLYAIFSDISRNKKKIANAENEYYIKSNTEKYNYTVYYGESGIPLEISETNFDISVIIKDAALL